MDRAIRKELIDGMIHNINGHLQDARSEIYMATGVYLDVRYTLKANEQSLEMVVNMLGDAGGAYMPEYRLPQVKDFPGN